MATYFFETITAAQALTYNQATDTLVFGTAGETAVRTSVAFVPASATAADSVIITSGTTGRSVTFGAGMYG